MAYKKTKREQEKIMKYDRDTKHEIFSKSKKFTNNTKWHMSHKPYGRSKNDKSYIR